jgi:predicted anti-sigma-YlaC factor YlaD
MGTEEPPWVARHLLECRDCRDDALRLAAETELLRAAFLSLPVSPGFTAEVMERIGRRRR